MEFEVGKKYLVEVIKLMPFGAIVRAEDGSTHIVHISNIANTFISDVGWFLSVGQQLHAECIAGKVKEKELSFKHLNLQSNEGR